MALHTEKDTRRIIGNWDLFEKIAVSGMGTVYKARSRLSGDLVAVKILPPFQAGKEQAYQRFARECRILSALHDPHIVRALDFGMEGFEPYLVTEYVEGESLAERVTRNGAIPEPEALRLIVQVAEALGRMHARGLVHRNVKPDSILITDDGQTKLTDLCLIKEVETQEALTRDGTWLGTPNFMAPEQFRDAAKARRRSDVYALGATLYTAVTGQPPFSGCNVLEMCTKKLRNELVPPQTLVPTLSDRTDRAIRKAMNAQPDLRQNSCDEFVASLRGSPTDESVRGTMEGALDSTDPDLQQPPNPAPERVMPTSQPQAALMAPADDDSSSSAWLWLVGFALIAAFVSGLYFLSGHAHFGN